jgi:hypothetical protein
VFRGSPRALLTLAALALLACGPSTAVRLGDLPRDAGGDRPGINPERPDAGAGVPETGPDTPPPDVGPPPVIPPDAAAEAALPVDAAVDRPPDLPDAAVPVDLPPDLPPPPPDLPPDLPVEAPEPAGPWLMVTSEPAQPLTNLTMAGAIDWVHFGQGGATRVNRKAGAPVRITMTAVGGNELFGYDDRPVRFSWTDGSPTPQINATPEGISNGENTGRGFELRVEGNVARARVLRAYLGVWGARALLSARFSDGSVPAMTDSTLTAEEPGRDRIYTIRFRPGQAGQALLVRWTVQAINLEFGNVTLQAATLSE